MCTLLTALNLMLWCLQVWSPVILTLCVCAWWSGWEGGMRTMASGWRCVPQRWSHWLCSLQTHLSSLTPPHRGQPQVTRIQGSWQGHEHTGFLSPECLQTHAGKVIRPIYLVQMLSDKVTLVIMKIILVKITIDLYLYSISIYLQKFTKPPWSTLHWTQNNVWRPSK